MADSYLNSLMSDNEQILMVTHRHWTILALEILSETILAISLIVLITLMLFVFPVLGPAVALGYFLLLFPAASLTRDVLIWSNRKFVITSRRVIQLAGVFNKDVT